MLPPHNINIGALPWQVSLIEPDSLFAPNRGSTDRMVFKELSEWRLFSTLLTQAPQAHGVPAWANACARPAPRLGPDGRADAGGCPLYLRVHLILRWPWQQMPTRSQRAGQRPSITGHLWSCLPPSCRLSCLLSKLWIFFISTKIKWQ